MLQKADDLIAVLQKADDLLKIWFRCCHAESGSTAAAIVEMSWITTLALFVKSSSGGGVLL